MKRMSKERLSEKEATIKKMRDFMPFLSIELGSKIVAVLADLVTIAEQQTEHLKAERAEVDRLNQRIDELEAEKDRSFDVRQKLCERVEELEAENKELHEILIGSTGSPPKACKPAQTHK
jgi:hypothetical protein